MDTIANFTHSGITASYSGHRAMGAGGHVATIIDYTMNAEALAAWRLLQPIGFPDVNEVKVRHLHMNSGPASIVLTLDDQVVRRFEVLTQTQMNALMRVLLVSESNRSHATTTLAKAA